jgi:arylsulfatase A-like enzyme
VADRQDRSLRGVHPGAGGDPGDALATGGATNSDVITNLDYAATFLDTAGVNPPAGYTLDGESLVPLVGGGGTWISQDPVLIEHYGGTHVPAYCGVRSGGYMYAQYSDGFEELYDLKLDPYELANGASDVSYSSTMTTLRSDRHALCSPPPPDWTWSHSGNSPVGVGS